jgi:hypothetical protein
MATKDRILAELNGGAKTTDEMIAKVGGSYAAVHTSLRRLQRAGKVVEITEENGKKLKNTRWLLTSQVRTGPAPAPAYVPLKPAKTKRTKAILVVDVSGSMNSLRYDLQKSVNATLADLRSQAFRTGDAIDVSLYYFNNYVRPEYKHVDARDVKSEPIKYPDGGTALFDAVEQAITEHLLPEKADEEVAYLLIVQTDGQDEHSRDRRGDRMKDLIRQVQGTDRWTITFQLPPGFLQKFCNTYGIHPGNCTEWERTTQGMERATDLRASATTTYFANRSLGQTSTKAFYATVDLDNLKTSTVKSQLDNIAGKVKTFPVAAEIEIRPFVESKTGLPYVAGEAFYQLTKTEKVQPGKKVLVAEKGTRAIYAGAQARTLIGLPSGVDCRVKPGNLSNYDVFVESNSVNRKLVRGTKVVLWPTANQ